MDRRVAALKRDLKAARARIASLRKDVDELREIAAALRTGESEAQADLDEARTEIRSLQAALKVAQDENKLLWKVNARNISRIEAEDAQYVRARVEAEMGRTRVTIDEEHPDLDGN